MAQLFCPLGVLVGGLPLRPLDIALRALFSFSSFSELLTLLFQIL